MRTPPAFSTAPDRIERVQGQVVHCFEGGEAHRDQPTIASFGEEWKKFSVFTEDDIRTAGDEYFDIVPQALLGPHIVGLDVGCGSGRWSRYLSSRIGHLDAIDPSQAIFHAARTHSDLPNVRWSQAGIDNIPFPSKTFDLVICLGVLHHVPETQQALEKIVAKLKPGGQLLMYLYYDLEGRGAAYKGLFRLSELLRKCISPLPGPIKRGVCDAIAWSIYVPLRGIVRGARRIDTSNKWWQRTPLSYYHNKSIRILRNDALDRFGTPLGKRFNKQEIQRMMEAAGLEHIRFSDGPPYWHAMGERALQ